MSRNSNPHGKRSLLAHLSLAAVTAAAALGGTAAAQTADPADGVAESEEIVVTGFRGSLAAAIDLKRDLLSPSMRSSPRTSPTSPISTSRNRFSGFQAWPSRATPAKAGK